MNSTLINSLPSFSGFFQLGLFFLLYPPKPLFIQLLVLPLDLGFSVFSVASSTGPIVYLSVHALTLSVKEEA
jgi:hypothetical protein